MLGIFFKIIFVAFLALVFIFLTEGAIKGYKYLYYDWLYKFSKNKRVFNISYNYNEYEEHWYKLVFFDKPTTTGKEVLEKMKFDEKKWKVSYVYSDGVGTKREHNIDLNKVINLKNVKDIYLFEVPAS